MYRKTSKVSTRSSVLGTLLAGALAGAFAGAGCVADVGQTSDDDNVTTVAQELEGARCGVGFPACESWLTCCREDYSRYYCRDLDWDEDNCGECGHECYMTDLCLEGECVYFGK